MSMFERVCHWCGYKWPAFVGNRCPRCGTVQMYMPELWKEWDKEMRDALDATIDNVLFCISHGNASFLHQVELEEILEYLRELRELRTQ